MSFFIKQGKIMKQNSITWALLTFILWSVQGQNALAEVKGGEVGNPASRMSMLCSNSSSKNLFYDDLGFTEAGFTFKPTYNKLIKDFASLCQKSSGDDNQIIKGIYQFCIDSCKERATFHSNDLSVTEKVFADKKKIFEKVNSQCMPLCDGIKIGLNAFKAGVSSKSDASSLREDCQNSTKDSISNLNRGMKQVEPTLVDKASKNSSAGIQK